MPRSALQVVGVEDLLAHQLRLAEAAALAQHAIDQRRLAVVDVGDDGDVANVLAAYGHVGWAGERYSSLLATPPAVNDDEHRRTAIDDGGKPVSLVALDRSFQRFQEEWAALQASTIDEAARPLYIDGLLNDDDPLPKAS